MKKSVLFNLLAVSALSTAALAQEGGYEKVVIKGDRSYEETVTYLCDDTALDGADFVVPGRPGRDFNVLFHTYVTDGRSSCKLVGVKDNKDGTHTYRVNADDDCEIEFRFKAKKTKVLYGFSAC